MLFDSKNVYLFQTGNHNSLILNNGARFWDSEFTLLMRFKPDKESSLQNTNMGSDHVGCPIAMNGKHIGIFYKVNEYEEQVVFEWWELGKQGDEFKSLVHSFKLDDKIEYFDVILRRNENKFTFSVNGKVLQSDTELLSDDYTHSLLWLGAATMFSEEHSFPFRGDIEKVSLNKSALTNTHVNKFFTDYDTFLKDLNITANAYPLFASSFKKHTYYKIMDESINGNHPILYKDEWLQK